ncbi:MAG: hypothetical protein OXT71_22015 [Acidobacteriota bacterium]|nr:hypothetical protein [Acidobacteriota bacterium]
MNQLISILIFLAVLAFIVGTLARFLGGGNLLGNEAVVYWRGSMGFLAFAVTLLLVQIRDK